MAKLIVGCGYLGKRVLQLWQTAGEKVYATTRSTERAAEWSRNGVVPLVADITQPIAADVPSDIDTVLFAVGFDAKAGHSIHEVYVDGLARVIDWLPASIRRFIYISSTGVYGSFAGEWIDEESPCEPLREGGKACLAAEQRLAASKFAAQSVALRLAGIYGPDRIPRAKDLLAGQMIDAAPGGYLNLIHVMDAARIVLLAEQRPTSSRLLVADGHPVIRGEYYAELARLLQAPPPNFVQSPGESAVAKRGSADKRVNNSRLMKELAPQFQFPDYRAGLADAVEHWKQSDAANL
ncbi:NAD dependent epimerase/dehydratase family protein [Anatilimnocola aggregata]|uniref:NAD dependent epimerase/dehydratase family protein n=1 Tax=Anatilimnocola aggregata TaxID=2528021 RepID=A0A517YDD3_9BACT|nr:SDR family oxidoreductase [Anatilimnocola aggregata]QDU28248.1 NAD dependent epimerase/dehydratase family protein [Anatilimnocola aggregata]